MGHVREIKTDWLIDWCTTATDKQRLEALIRRAVRVGLYPADGPNLHQLVTNATATLGGIARGNDGGNAAVIAACNAAVIARVIASALQFSCQQWTGRRYWLQMTSQFYL